MKTPITKAIIAAAGFGTRFLPQTKAMPKEMLPLIDKPIIQYVVEELVEAGIKDIIIVGSSNKRSIEDHFDTTGQDLVLNLQNGGPAKQPLLEEVEAIADLANFVYIRQKGPYGNATPLACAAHLIGDEPFIYTFADDFFVASPGRTSQLIAIHDRYRGSVLACKQVEHDDEYDRYGIAGGKLQADGSYKVEKIVEKPGAAAAPSNLATVSGYLLTPQVFNYIEVAMRNHKSGELMLQPIMQQMIDDGQNIYAKQIEHGTYYDTGDKLEYLKTVIDFALDRPDTGQALLDHLRKKLQ